MRGFHLIVLPFSFLFGTEATFIFHQITNDNKKSMFTMTKSRNLSVRNSVGVPNTNLPLLYERDIMDESKHDIDVNKELCGTISIQDDCVMNVQQLEIMMKAAKENLEQIEQHVERINTSMSAISDIRSFEERNQDEKSNQVNLVDALAYAREADLKYGLCSDKSNHAWARVDELYASQKDENKKRCEVISSDLLLSISNLHFTYTEILSEIDDALKRQS